MNTDLLRRIFRGIGLALAILILLIEDAAWAILGPLSRLIARWNPIAEAEAWIARQSPALIAVLFIVPTLIIWPIKLWGAALIGLGRPRFGLAVLIGAEIFGTLLLARLWTIGRDKLLTIRWLAWIYGRIESFRRHVYGWVRRQPAWIAAKEWLTTVRQYLGRPT